MREIFTSGSTRGEWVAPLAGLPSLLLYRDQGKLFAGMTGVPRDWIRPVRPALRDQGELFAGMTASCSAALSRD